MNKIVENILYLLYPKKCPFCHRVIPQNEYSCEKCRHDFPEITYKKCTINSFMSVSPFPYEDKYKGAILNFKFHNKKQYAKSLAHYTAISICQEFSDIDFDLITAVPMHIEEHNQRKYNQAELLGKEIAIELGLPYIETLNKVKLNEKQHKLSAKERLKNVKGAYKVLDKNLIKDKNILIIDDIITTGSTLGECCKVLEKSGANRIFCGTVCLSIYKTS